MHSSSFATWSRAQGSESSPWGTPFCRKGVHSLEHHSPHHPPVFISPFLGALPRGGGHFFGVGGFSCMSGALSAAAGPGLASLGWGKGHGDASPHSGLREDFAAPQGTAAALSSSEVTARSVIRPQCVQNRRAKRVNPGAGRGRRGRWGGVCAGLRWMGGWRSASREEKGHGLAPNSAVTSHWWDTPSGIWPFSTGEIHPGNQTHNFHLLLPGLGPAHAPLAACHQLLSRMRRHCQRGAKTPCAHKGLHFGHQRMGGISFIYKK